MLPTELSIHLSRLHHQTCPPCIDNTDTYQWVIVLSSLAVDLCPLVVPPLVVSPCPLGIPPSYLVFPPSYLVFPPSSLGEQAILVRCVYIGGSVGNIV